MLVLAAVAWLNNRLYSKRPMTHRAAQTQQGSLHLGAATPVQEGLLPMQGYSNPQHRFPVVGCKIPRKENSLIFRFLSHPPLFLFPRVYPRFT